MRHGCYSAAISLSDMRALRDTAWAHQPAVGTLLVPHPEQFVKREANGFNARMAKAIARNFAKMCGASSSAAQSSAETSAHVSGQDSPDAVLGKQSASSCHADGDASRRAQGSALQACTEASKTASTTSSAARSKSEPSCSKQTPNGARAAVGTAAAKQTSQAAKRGREIAHLYPVHISLPATQALLQIET